MAIIHGTEQNFASEVLQSEQPVLVDFWASWCGPCQMLAPVLEQLAQEQPELKICKVNVDEEPTLAQKYGVMSIPTLVVIKNGAAAATRVGFQSKEEILDLMKQA